MTDTFLRDRVFAKLIIEPETGCLLWTGAISGGYGRIKIDGVNRLVHPVVYEFFAGPVPDNLDLDHLCRVRRCANVAHLEPVTRQANISRGNAGLAESLPTH